MSFETVKKFIVSWNETVNCVNTLDELYEWINGLNQTTHVSITETTIDSDSFWYYDTEGSEIRNRKGTFFTVKGIEGSADGETACRQPVIIQNEIGYLGIICKEFNGVLHMLMQAKIEPGNINCVQISPTIQATKSNFTRAHGGKSPAYLDYFLNSSEYRVVYDQIQSEQSSRFYKKRNRNMIMIVDEEIEVLGNFRWMTLGQLKALMKTDNLVNMDTRTVLSGIPLVTDSISREEKKELKTYFSDKAFYKSVFETSVSDTLPMIYQKINDYKMLRAVESRLIALSELDDWENDESGIVCRKPADFMVKYYDIEIEGREVQHWTQPLFKAIGIATFGLIAKNFDGVMKFLVRIKPEIGSFDSVELGPSVQWEPTHNDKADNGIDKLFRRKLNEKGAVCFDALLSEEGGRFYHEQNRNVIIKLEEDEDIPALPDYIWTDYSTLNYLVQVNNTMNIQLRNLLSLLDI